MNIDIDASTGRAVAIVMTMATIAALIGAGSRISATT
jgi:hypothetical protein